MFVRTDSSSYVSMTWNLLRFVALLKGFIGAVSTCRPPSNSNHRSSGPSNSEGSGSGIFRAVNGTGHAPCVHAPLNHVGGNLGFAQVRVSAALRHVGWVDND
eukprot:8664790-Pyramimonas_sp.AAC.1